MEICGIEANTVNERMRRENYDLRQLFGTSTIHEIEIGRSFYLP